MRELCDHWHSLLCTDGVQHYGAQPQFDVCNACIKHSTGHCKPIIPRLQTVNWMLQSHLEEKQTSHQRSLGVVTHSVANAQRCRFYQKRQGAARSGVLPQPLARVCLPGKPLCLQAPSANLNELSLMLVQTHSVHKADCAKVLQKVAAHALHPRRGRGRDAPWRNHRRVRVAPASGAASG